MVAFKDIGPRSHFAMSHTEKSQSSIHKRLQRLGIMENQTEKLKGQQMRRENPTLCVVSYKPGEGRVQDRKSESSSLEILREKKD